MFAKEQLNDNLRNKENKQKNKKFKAVIEELSMSIQKKMCMYILANSKTLLIKIGN